jgi:hypothetical protein
MMTTAWHLDRQEPVNTNVTWAKHYNTKEQVNFNPRVANHGH